MARIATLNNNTNDDNDDSILPNEFPIAERVSIARRQQPFKSNENIIYWEAQGKDRMCALHCLNTLLQVHFTIFFVGSKYQYLSGSSFY